MDLNFLLHFWDDCDFINLAAIYLASKDKIEEEKIPPFDFNLIKEEDCQLDYRFKKEDLTRLLEALRIPDYLYGNNGIKFSGIEGLCIFLRRLAYPNRLHDLTKNFPNRDFRAISKICTTMMNYIYDNYHHLVTEFDHPWMTQEHLEIYATAIHMAGVPLENCIGFVDGTLRPTCKPSQNQREFYSGHKRTHGIKFQAVNLANGLICHLHGPVNGRRHDAFMLRESDLLEKLAQLPMSGQGIPYCIYGDPAYPIHEQLLGPYKGANLAENQQLFNRVMSESRVSIEWEFGKPVGKLYIVGTILKNCQNCLYGSQSSSKFQVNPPSLEDYLYIR